MPTTCDDSLFATARSFGRENSYRQLLYRLLYEVRRADGYENARVFRVKDLKANLDSIYNI